MKRLLLVILCTALCLMEVVAQTSVITCSFKDASLIDILKKIQASTPKSINYVYEELEPLRLTVRLKKTTAEDALRLVALELPVSVIEDDNAFYVTISENTAVADVSRSHWLPMITVEKEKQRDYHKVGEVKICMSLPRRDYRAGDTVFYCARTLNPALWEPDYHDQLLYVALFDKFGTCQVHTQSVRKDGTFIGCLSLPSNLPSGQYRLTALCESMSHVSSICIPQYLITVDNPLESEMSLSAHTLPRIKFNPEGGVLVAGATQRIAYRAMESDGSPIDMRGVIVNSQGDTICRALDAKGGMGQFAIPASALTDTTQRLLYLAELPLSRDDTSSIRRRFLLPRIHRRSHTLQMLHTDYLHHLAVHIEEIQDHEKQDSLTIAIYDKYHIYQAKRIGSISQDLVLNIERCAPGVKFLGLFSKEKELISEIPFLKMFEEKTILPNVMHERVGLDSIRLSISLKDSIGNRIYGNFSISLNTQATASYFLSDLLLRSELPDYCSEINDSIFLPEQREQLDLLIQTGASFIEPLSSQALRLGSVSLSVPRKQSTWSFEKWYGKEMFHSLPESARRNACTLVAYLSDVAYSQDHNVLRFSNESGRLVNSYHVDGSPAWIPYQTRDFGSTYPENKIKDADVHSLIQHSYIIPKLQIVDSFGIVKDIKKKDLKKLNISQIDHVIMQKNGQGQGLAKLFMTSTLDSSSINSLPHIGTGPWFPTHSIDPLIMTIDSQKYLGKDVFLRIEGFTSDGCPVSFDTQLPVRNE